MKWMKFLFIAVIGMGLMTALPSCKKEKDEASCTDGIQNGNETGVDCGGDCAPCEVGIQGKWWSKGADVAPLLVTLFAIDSIYAEFRTDLTYTVTSYSAGAPSTLTGVYTQSESGVGTIWNITVNQNSPSALTSTGIFQVTGDNMTYEVVQTTPDIGATPPTAAAGFGSTSGGAFGVLNVQKYVRAN